MAESLTDKILSRLAEVRGLYHSLVLVAAPRGSGKTAALQEVASRIQAPLLNLNLEVSRRLLDLTARQRALRLQRIVEEIVACHPREVLLDNIELIFDVAYQSDPLRLLQSLSRHRSVVATWNGLVADGQLTYAAPGHPEYRRYPSRDLVLLGMEASA